MRHGKKREKHTKKSNQYQEEKIVKSMLLYAAAYILKVISTVSTTCNIATADTVKSPAIETLTLKQLWA